MNNRNDKVNFLKGLITGKRSLYELSQQKFETFEQLTPGSSFFRRITRGANDAKDYTRAEVESFKKSRPKTNLVVIMDYASCAPVLQDSDIIWREEKLYV